MPYLLIHSDPYEGSSIQEIPTMAELQKKLRELSKSTLFDSDDYEVYKFTKELSVTSLLSYKKKTDVHR